MSPTSLEPPFSATECRRHPDAPPPGTEIIGHHDECFACGQRPGSLGMRFVAAEGPALDCAFDIAERHLGAPGIAHGGLLAGALDEAFGRLAVVLRKRLVTVVMQVEYRRPVLLGDPVRLHVRADVEAGKQVYVSGVARTGAPDGPIAVHAWGVYAVVSRQHFERYEGSPHTARP